MNRFFSRSKPSNKTKQPIIVVSGLPRSGTSMMMKMLGEGGLSILTDELRRADSDNPNGYFEFETVKQMSEGNIAWLANAGGKVIKVISALLEYLPSNYSYKIIFLERDLQEVLASQRKMLIHRNEESSTDDTEIAVQLQKHLSVVKPWLARQPHMDVLYVNYNDLMANPEPFCQKITDFLNMALDQEKMLAVPNARLYRNRAGIEK